MLPHAIDRESVILPQIFCFVVYIYLTAAMFVHFTQGGNLVRREVAHNLMRLIAEGTDDERTDVELRQDAVSNYIELLDKPNLPDILIKIICWVMFV